MCLVRSFSSTILILVGTFLTFHIFWFSVSLCIFVSSNFSKTVPILRYFPKCKGPSPGLLSQRTGKTRKISIVKYWSIFVTIVWHHTWHVYRVYITPKLKTLTVWSLCEKTDFSDFATALGIVGDLRQSTPFWSKLVYICISEIIFSTVLEISKRRTYLNLYTFKCCLN